MSEKPANTNNNWADPDDAPELNDAWFENAEIMHGSKIVRPGRVIGSGVKASQTIRFDVAILDAFKSTGKGWQTRMNDALREWLKDHPMNPA